MPLPHSLHLLSGGEQNASPPQGTLRSASAPSGTSLPVHLLIVTLLKKNKQIKQNWKTKPGRVVHTFNRRTWKAEASRSLRVQGYPGLQSSRSAWVIE